MSIKNRLSQLKQKRKAAAENEIKLQHSVSQDFLLEANKIMSAVKSKIANIQDWYTLNEDIQTDIIKKFLSEEIKDDNFLGINLDGFISKTLSQVNGYGVLDNILNDEQIVKIFVNSTNYISILKENQVTKLPLKFDTDNELLGTVRRILSLAKIEFRQDIYFYEGRLPDGLLFNVVLPPVSKEGITLTISRTDNSSYDFEHLIQANFISYDASKFLYDMFKASKNILVAGNHNSGKQILLSAIASLKSYGSRVFCVEDYKTNLGDGSYIFSYDISDKNVYESSLGKIFENIANQHPDGLIVPTCYDEIAMQLLKIMQDGVNGIIASIYSPSLEEVPQRFLEKVLACSKNYDIKELKNKIAKYIDFVVFIDDSLKEDKVFVYHLSIDDDGIFKFKKAVFEKTLQKRAVSPRKTTLKRQLKK